MFLLQKDTFKRSAQGYSYPTPDKQLNLPEKFKSSPEVESLEVGESGTSFLRAAPLTLTTPSTNLRIIQEIHLSPSSQRPRVAKQKQNNPGALRFNDNPLVAVLGRQVKVCDWLMETVKLIHDWFREIQWKDSPMVFPT